MAILKVVVADFLVSEGLVSLGELNKALVQRFNGLILGGVRADFIGVVDQGETLIVAGNSFLVGALFQRIR
jgi:hypothetical protein